MPVKHLQQVKQEHVPHTVHIFSQSGNPLGFPFSHDIELFSVNLTFFTPMSRMWDGLVVKKKTKSKNGDVAHTDVQVTPSICTNSPHIIRDLITRALA